MRDATLVTLGGLLWGFNLLRKQDEKGIPIEISIDLRCSRPLLITKPEPFVMAFEPRSETRKSDMTQGWEAACVET